jgi:azurin
MYLLGVLLMFTSPSTQAEPTVIKIGTLPGLRYDVKRFDVKPGEDVRLVFENKDTMLHNLVITKPGKRMEIIQAAMLLGTQALAKHFVPDSPNVLWSTEVVASNDSFTLTFKAPSEKDDYPYVCTYPGHGFIMYGTMRVTDSPEPKEMNTGPMVAMAEHHHDENQAIVKRGFMPDAGPATIAVKLPGGHSYCWDAGAVCFRYAWQGDFMEQVYRKPAKLLGKVYYREDHKFPFLLGADSPTRPSNVRFLGYSLDETGIPEFEYEADRIHFKERLVVTENKLVRRFRTTSDQTVELRFPIDPDQSPQLDSTGKREGDAFVFSGKDAEEFYIIVVPTEKK